MKIFVLHVLDFRNGRNNFLKKFHRELCFIIVYIVHVVGQLLLNIQENYKFGPSMNLIKQF